MDTDNRELRTTDQIIGCAFAVANELGPGFLEKVYENALVHAQSLGRHPPGAMSELPEGDWSARLPVVELRQVTRRSEASHAVMTQRPRSIRVHLCPSVVPIDSRAAAAPRTPARSAVSAPPPPDRVPAAPATHPAKAPAARQRSHPAPRSRPPARRH